MNSRVVYLLVCIWSSPAAASMFAAKRCGRTLSPAKADALVRQTATALDELEAARDDVTRESVVNRLIDLERDVRARERVRVSAGLIHDRIWRWVMSEPPAHRWPGIYLLAAMANPRLSRLGQRADAAYERAAFDLVAREFGRRYPVVHTDLRVRRAERTKTRALAIETELIFRDETVIAPNAGRLNFAMPAWLHRDSRLQVGVYREAGKSRADRTLVEADFLVESLRQKNQPTLLRFKVLLLEEWDGEAMLFVDFTIDGHQLNRTILTRDEIEGVLAANDSASAAEARAVSAPTVDGPIDSKAARE